MPRLCIVADSHAGALKAGWTTIRPEYLDIEITFFAAPRKAMSGLEIANGSLVPANEALRSQLIRSSGGQPEIAGDFDLYLVYALNSLLLSQALQIRLDNPNIGDTGMEERLMRQFHESLSAQTIAKLARCTRSPIVLMATPFKPKPDDHLLWNLADDEAGRVAAVFARACRRFGSELGVTFEEQPPETLTPNKACTRLIYAYDLKKDGISKPDETHMNGAYGAIAMRQVLTHATLPIPITSQAQRCPGSALSAPRAIWPYP